MNYKYKNSIIGTFFFVAITFLYLTAIEDASCGSTAHIYASDSTYIEETFQPELPDKYLPHKGSFSLKQKKAYVPFNTKNIFDYRKIFLLSASNIRGIYVWNQNENSLSFHHIISILQKKNTWHQSSDDDSLLFEYC